MLTRRQFLPASAGLLGLSLPEFFSLRSQAAARPTRTNGKAKSCIVLYCWGGMSQLETWDPKSEAPAEVRASYQSIATATPGIRVGEYMPLLARQTERLAIVRSVHHTSTFHGKGMYWNLTGHAPAQATAFVNQPPSAQDWPCLGAMVSKLKAAPKGLPGAVQIPYPLVDNNTLQAGDGPGWLGAKHAPLLLRPAKGKPYGGVSRDLGVPVLQLAEGVDRERLQERAGLARTLSACPPSTRTVSFDHFQQLAFNLMFDPKVRKTLDLEQEPAPVQAAYGDHICGQSVLLARRLAEAGVPLITVVCGAGDLNGAAGDNWDTHSENFTRLKSGLLPPLEQASSALLNDLADRGMLDETLVVWLTEFGRTPKAQNGTGRDHYPFCYSVAFAGGGIRGGQVYGRSDRIASTPADRPCGPNDLHATIFQALGIPLDAQLEDHLGRPFHITDGQPLPLFG
ncbi:MAG: DUF1501 domain-containing protein [Planctomycetia bacterium]|nr:DUF1501 domain-containing protein [Planctomycetia bacterium]